MLAELNDPAARLFQAVQRYTDSLHVAAEQLLGPHAIAELDQADQYIPGLTTEPAWPTLRAHLLDLAAETGKHPLRHMLTAASGHELRTADDMAAVLDWRLPEMAPVDPGPLPWLPGIPETLHSHPVWGPYVTKRSQLVADLADQVQNDACQADGPPPVWSAAGSHPNTALIGEIAVWRAANGIKPQDPRPTGGTQLETRFRLCGNSDSTDISPIPPIHQTTQGPTNDSEHTPHIDAGATTGKAHTKQLVNV